MGVDIDNLQSILQHRHHPEAQQIHLHDPHVGAVVLVPLDDHPAGHRCVLERHHVVQSSLAHDHAAGMLAEMTRQILNLRPQPPELLNGRMETVHARVAQVAFERFLRIDPLELIHDFRERVDLRRLEPEDLADFPRRAAAAIGDHVRGHGGPRTAGRQPGRAVLFVDVLDHTLATVAARQIEIDVRPLASLFRQKSLEEQIHTDRIHGGNAEAIADGAVGR
ncbi:MAG TPA: hypothetical protein VL484_11080 [Vicinamibacterales bacterium]|nr:hypothetical protein [Vicinamibacterales bacterium]